VCIETQINTSEGRLTKINEDKKKENKTTGSNTNEEEDEEEDDSGENERRCVTEPRHRTWQPNLLVARCGSTTTKSRSQRRGRGSIGTEEGFKRQEGLTLNLGIGVANGNPLSAAVRALEHSKGPLHVEQRCTTHPSSLIGVVIILWCSIVFSFRFHRLKRTPSLFTTVVY
jgi:hypothetical protein